MATVTGMPVWLGERGREIGARLLHRGGQVGVDHEDETAGHPLIARCLIVGHNARS